MTTEPGKVHRGALHTPHLRARSETKTKTESRLTAGSMTQ